MSNRQFIFLLFGVLVVGFGLRIWGAYFGLPHVYNTDEVFEVARAVRLGMLDFDFDRIAKGGYYYFLFGLYGVYFVFGWLFGVFDSVAAFADHYIQQPSAFWAIGRTSTVLIGTATIGLVAFFTHRRYGPLAALAASLFMAFSYRHVVDSHYITVDVPMTFFIFWALSLLVERQYKQSKLADTGLVATAAIAIMHKLPSVMLLLSVALSEIFAKGWPALRTLRLYILGLCIVILYLIADLGVVLHIGRILSTIGDMFSGVFGSTGAVPSENLAHSELPNLYQFYAQTLIDSQGYVILGLALAGLVVSFSRGEKSPWLHLSFMLPYMLLFTNAGDTHHYYERYAVPILPSICLFAGIGVKSLADRVRQPQFSRVVICMVLLIAIATPSYSIYKFNTKHSNPDTRTLAFDWIENNLEASSSILMEGMPGHVTQFAVPLRPSATFIDRQIELLDKDPGKRLFWERTKKLQAQPTYDLTLVNPVGVWPKFSDISAQNIDYVLVEKRWFVAPGRTHSLFPILSRDSRFAFYESLTKNAELLVNFDPKKQGGLGYNIEIWRLRSAPDINLH